MEKSAKQPTERQLEAWGLAHILGKDNTEIADYMGISEQRVGQLLKAYYKIRPKDKPDYKDLPNKQNTISLDTIADCDENHKV